MKELNKITHPLFILSLSLLILNDWYFKTAFHNEVTGKLSDFAGLFAFSFFFGALFSENKRFVHFLTGILFVLWNSEFSQPLINHLNNFGLPVIRTVDFTDNIALISIFASYQCLNHPFKYESKPFLQKALVVISCLAFMATTLPPRENKKFVNIDKTYQFEFSKRELVSRLNMVQLREIQNLSRLYGNIDFNSETGVFHYNGRTDTLALIIDHNKISENDTIEFKTFYAEILLMGNQSNSELKLLSVYKTTPIYSEDKYKEKTIEQFEKRIIKKIKKLPIAIKNPRKNF